MRCMRRVFASIVSRKRSRLSVGSSRSRNVSANPAMTVSGVLSSCETLATKSRRIVSSRRRVVRSCTATTAPPSGSGRAETTSVRSPTPISSGPAATPAIAPRTASRTSRSCGSRSVEKGTASFEIEQPARALVQAHHAASRAHGDDSFVERVDDGGEERVLRLQRRQSRRELFGHALQRGGEVADFAGRRQRRPSSEIAGGDGRARRRAIRRSASRRRARNRMRRSKCRRVRASRRRSRRRARRSRSRGTSPCPPRRARCPADV